MQNIPIVDLLQNNHFSYPMLTLTYLELKYFIRIAKIFICIVLVNIRKFLIVDLSTFSYLPNIDIEQAVSLFLHQLLFLYTNNNKFALNFKYNLTFIQLESKMISLCQFVSSSNRRLQYHVIECSRSRKLYSTFLSVRICYNIERINLSLYRKWT